MTEAWHAAHASTLAVVSNPGLFEFSGPDARRFLNGMVTNNVQSLAVGDAVATGVCDAKGRILGLLDLWCTADDTFVAVLDGIEVDWFEARYTKYIVFDDVELNNLAARYSVLHLVGPDAARHLPDSALCRPARRAVTGGFDCLVPRDFDPSGDGVVVGTADDLELLRIELGMPRFPVDFDERSGPHVMGLVDRIVAFDKGCYVGQETIHRIDAMGRVKRHFSAMRVEGDGPVAVGAEVEHGGRTVGAVTSSAVLPGLGAVALGVLKEPASDDGATLSVSGRTAYTVRRPLGTQS